MTNRLKFNAPKTAIKLLRFRKEPIHTDEGPSPPCAPNPADHSARLGPLSRLLMLVPPAPPVSLVPLALPCPPCYCSSRLGVNTF